MTCIAPTESLSLFVTLRCCSSMILAEILLCDV